MSGFLGTPKLCLWKGILRIYTFVQQMFAEALLCAKISVKHLGHSHKLDRSPCLVRPVSWWGSRV